MPERPSRPPPALGRNPHRALRRRGLLLSASIGLVFAALIITLMVRGMSRDELPQQKMIEEIPPLEIGQTPAGQQAELAGPVQNARVNLMARGDRTRKLGELRMARIEPAAERQHYRVAEPKTWIFLQDGRAVHIRADEGRFFIPDGASEPESGTLIGDVTLHLYEAGLDRAAPEQADGSLRGMLRTESLYFDRTVGELSTADDVSIWTPELDAQVRGSMAIINETRERLERLEMLSDGMAVYRGGMARHDTPPPAPEEPATPHAPPPPPPPPDEAAPAPKPPPAPVQVFYHITLNDDVTLMQQGRRITSDALEGWLRMIDGALPEDAIGDISFARSAGGEPVEPPATDARPSDGAEVTLARQTATQPEDDGAHADKSAEAQPGPRLPLWAVDEGDPEDGDAIRLTWKGPAVVVPLEAAPAELEHDHVALRFTSARPGDVAFRDDQTGAHGRMKMLDYGATMRRMVFSGPGDDGARVVLPGSGAMEAGRIESDFATGFVQAVGASALMPDAGERFRISSSQGASFVLLKHGAAITAELEQAIFDGDVRMETADGSASAGFARAHFVTTGNQANNLVLLVLEDEARMETVSGDWLDGDRLDITFAPGAARNDPEPRRLLGRGSVRAGRAMGEATQTMAAEYLEATLARDDNGRLQVGEAVLREGVEIVRAGSRIRGQDVTIEPGGRVLHVRSPGDFAHDDGDSQLTAAWSHAMWYDDMRGTLECEGDVTAESRPDAFTVERIQAEQLSALITPADAEVERREVLHIAAAGPDSGRAHFESRRYPAGAGDEADNERVLQQLLYLEGATILADNQRGTLDVPTSGRLLVVDERAQDTADQRDDGEGVAGNPPTATGRGQMLVDWDRRLTMDRRSGEMEVEENVRGTHRRQHDGEVMNLSSDHLTIWITPQEGEGGSDFRAGGRLTDDGVQLLAALARGSVHLSSGPAAQPGEPAPLSKELTADEVAYDAVEGIVEASAASDNWVTFFDPGAPAPTRARSIWWNLITDEMRAQGLAPVVVPR